MSGNPPVQRRTWVAACSHRLQRQWPSVDPAEVEDLAATLWQDARLRELEPTDAAVEWLRPVLAPLALTDAPTDARLKRRPRPAGRRG